METTKSAIEETIEAFSPIIRSVIKKTSPQINSLDLDDIEQEVKIKIWKLLSKSETKICNLGSYIWKVTYTSTCNIMEKEYKRKMISIDEAKMKQVIINEGYESKANFSIDHQYNKEKLMSLLEKSIDTLINSRRQVLKLYLVGMSKDEISGFLGWTADKVRNLLYRGIKDLKIKLEKKGIQSFF